MTKNKINAHKTVRYYTSEEMQVIKQQENMRMLLGIKFILDSHKNLSKSRDERLSIPSMYTHLYEYELDKQKAESYIINNKQVPEALKAKLIKARLELEQRGVLEQLTEEDFK